MCIRVCAALVEVDVSPQTQSHVFGREAPVGVTVDLGEGVEGETEAVLGAEKPQNTHTRHKSRMKPGFETTFMSKKNKDPLSFDLARLFQDWRKFLVRYAWGVGSTRDVTEV